MLGRRGVRSVRAGAARVLTRSTLFFALHSSSAGTFAHGGGFLVILAAAGLGKDAGFFTGAAKAPQDDIERLVLADFYTGHVSGNLSRSVV